MPDLRARLQATLGAGYRVTRELTGGGMARVFLAEELELEREVVVKVVAPHLVDQTLLARFRAEILQTARLQHPTIVSVLGAGVIDEGSPRALPYYVMPYVRGESLRSRLNHENTLSLGTTIRILRSVLDALVHAHAHAVVHRDIKPENIFLSGSAAVLADFGIARSSPPAATLRITSPGTSVGTPVYTAPEQLAGDAQVDERADLFSVGVVAFEMLTGRLPWDGASTSEMLAAHARGEVHPLVQMRPDVPTELAAVINQCLSWSAADRPQSASAMLRTIETIAVTPSSSARVVGSVTPARRTPRRRGPVSRRLRWGLTALGVVAAALVVVTLIPDARGDARVAVGYPVIDGAGGADSAFALQLFNELHESLAAVAGVTLVERSAIIRWIQSRIAPAQLEDSLRSVGVDTMLVVRIETRAGGSRLIGAELVRPGTRSRTAVGDRLPVGAMDGIGPDSVRVIARMLAAQVAHHLGLVSASRDVSQTQVVDAVLAFFAARDKYELRTPEALAEAIRLLEQALQLDPTYAQAYAELAQVFGLCAFYRYRTEYPPYEMVARAIRLANQAVELQPRLAEGYTARAYVGTLAGAPLEDVERNYNAAARLKPDHQNFRSWRNAVLALKGRFTEALDSLDVQMELNKRSPSIRISAALYALPARDYPKVVRHAREAAELEPDIPFIGALLLWGRTLLGPRARSECDVAAGPHLGARAACLSRARDEAGAQRLRDSLERMATAMAPIDSTFDNSVYAAELAQFYASRGLGEDAARWLNFAFRESPAGVDVRILHSGLFDDQLVAAGERLRAEAWQRVSRAVPTR